MTAEEYFGDWMKVIDKKELGKIMRWLSTLDKSTLCPSYKNIFKAFRLCPYNDCRVIFCGLDPYPQEGVATGILFGNSKDTITLSPSLQIIKEAVINYEIPHGRIEFDNTLELWAKQGILMINTALTCEVNKVGSHFNMWKPFMSKLLYNMSSLNSGLIFVLFGNQAQSFKENIKYAQHVLNEYHPAFYARRGIKMSGTVFNTVNKLLMDMNNIKIEYFKEYGSY